MTIKGIAPDVSYPEPSERISGAPEFTCWEMENAPGGISTGRWHATPGKSHFEKSYWEYVRVISGVSIVTGEDGVPHRIKAGDSLVLRDGFKGRRFKGTWKVIEPTLKDCVIRD